jgi:ABC-2 type transport system ATP-binding protein
VAVVDGVDLDVSAGECVGILGPNGAGKTTTLEMIEGLRRPDAGTIDVLGHSPWPRDRTLLRRIGVQLQTSAFIEHLSALDQLHTVAELFGVPRANAESTLELVGLTQSAGTDIDDLSGGQRQRLAIGCALVHEPEVLFLDEPTTGLDPSARRRLWDLLAQVRARGTTIVLTTHYMEEAETLCDRVAVMERGRVLALGPPAELVRTLDAPTRLLLPPDALDHDVAAAMTGVEAVRREPGAMSLETRTPATVIEQLAAADALSGLQVRSGTLEDVFLAMTGRRLDHSESGDDEDHGSDPDTAGTA